MADLIALLDEISSDNPCGEYLEYDPVYLELGKNIQGKPEDPITGEKAQPPNWREIQRDALAILRQSKDIQIVIFLIRALINLEGLTGFRDGLNLLYGLLEKYWDQIHPLLDPEDDLDPTARVNILEELSNFESVLRPLSLAPLVDSKSAGRFTLRDVQIATDKAEAPEGSPKPEISMIRAAFLDAPEETVAATYQAVNESVSLIQQLEALVGDKVGIENGPDLSGLNSQLKEMRHAFAQYADTGLTEADAQSDGDELASGDSGSAGSSRKSAAVGAISSRQDVLKTLDLICKYYAENEPSSPVPILLQRAKFLVTSDFMQIVQNLLPDGLTQLQQIKGPDPEADQNY
ncbi:type VI secretion system protein TssA [Methylomonas sp. LL1]|uniref:type VI secretion system protein TssA n=1 Tax=Methylomonas sp. LL1 TaxID=2785785 RepID=UPI0018C3AE7B|nr:type VI secretion system protein TssA [Methylomonas sp. LL1]QPK63343.1 type VI secretion system protein TssA [Methylomonas sp. LL1]